MTEVLLSFVVGLAGGYLIGRLDTLIASFRGEESTSFVAGVIKEQKQKKKVQIDETKYVTDVSTDNFEGKTGTKLGVVSTTTDDITSASSKLAQLKKSKQ